MRRDFTYVDDLVEAVMRLMATPPVSGQPVGAMDSLSPVAPWRVVNIAGGQPVELMRFIAVIEAALGEGGGEAMLPMQAGDADTDGGEPGAAQCAGRAIEWTSIEDWVAAFVAWYRSEYRR